MVQYLVNFDLLAFGIVPKHIRALIGQSYQKARRCTGYYGIHYYFVRLSLPGANAELGADVHEETRDQNEERAGDQERNVGHVVEVAPRVLQVKPEQDFYLDVAETSELRVLPPEPLDFLLPPDHQTFLVARLLEPPSKRQDGSPSALRGTFRVFCFVMGMAGAYGPHRNRARRFFATRSFGNLGPERLGIRFPRFGRTLFCGRPLTVLRIMNLSHATLRQKTEILEKCRVDQPQVDGVGPVSEGHAKLLFWLLNHRGRRRLDFDERFVAVHDFVQVVEMVVYGEVLHVLGEPTARVMRGPLRVALIVLAQIQTLLGLADPVVDKSIFQALAALGVEIVRLFRALDVLGPGFAGVVTRYGLALHGASVLVLSFFLDFCDLGADRLLIFER